MYTKYKILSVKSVNFKYNCIYFHNNVLNLNKYSNTVLLPKTKFPQRLTGKKLSEQNKYVYENAGFEDLYKWQRETLTGSEFILHDGPPYANGSVHMGHTINKVLKDIINRYNVIQGRKVHYIPGWDCHGLPIELKALKKTQTADKTTMFIRNTAQEFATKTIEKQRDVFKSWGVMGDWTNSYFTYSVPYIKNQLKQFYKLYERKLIFRDVKPVYWSPSSRTALAEAELEYKEQHKSISAFVRFQLTQLPSILNTVVNSSSNVYALIWTTTPWTLPSNQAICYNPELNYSLIKFNNDPSFYIIANELIGNVSNEFQQDLNVITTFSGNELKMAMYRVPFDDKNVKFPFLSGQHANATKGTGLVHTAPAHGPDDFLLALNYNIPLKCIVDETGCYTKEAGVFENLHVLEDGNESVLSHLGADVLKTSEFTHSYPYDWRTKKPVIIRASQQWFVDTNALKNRAIELLEDVNIYPEKSSVVYKNNFKNQLKKRPYWCISRQRVWGVPIPVFYDTRTQTPIISESIINHLCTLLDKHGNDYWWTLPTSELIPTQTLTQLNLKLETIKKGEDILDIWFDSGISWSTVLGNNKIADLYLEGVDQFTGWFQSSLLTSVALRDQAPYKSIYVHGFAVDQNGHKMSKSLGNVIDPETVIHGDGKKQIPFGIDTVRWWVACHVSQDSTCYVGNNALQSSANEVQKIRNTLRFAISTLNDYNDSNVNYSNLKFLDKYLLHLVYEFNSQVSEFYNNYQLNRLCFCVINFVTNPVSALYYSLVKDRLYCNDIDDPNRRSAQFVLNILLNTIARAIAPIVPHLIEELFMYHTNRKQDGETFFKTTKCLVGSNFQQPHIVETMETILSIKRDLNKISSNLLDKKVEILLSEDLFEDFKILKIENELIDILQVAEIQLTKSIEIPTKNYRISINTSTNCLCPRCRRFTSKFDDHLCIRCTNVVQSFNNVAITA